MVISKQVKDNQVPSLHEDWIDPQAFRIVKTLQDNGFETYLVGGCVRDLLVGIHPKDYDIATSAVPQQVRRKIGHSYVIGRRFRLVLVRRGESQYEVATFRRNISSEEMSEDAENSNAQEEKDAVVGDNYFGTSEEDARRRDFTINALFYNPIQHKIVDFVHGMEDLKARTLRMIGSPKGRLIEDPIRILRAIRLSHKINFIIEPELRAAIKECAPELKKSVLPRKREEYLKILRLENPSQTFTELFDLGVLAEILPGLDSVYAHAEKYTLFDKYIDRMLTVGINTQEPVELYAGFLYAFLKAIYNEELPQIEKIEENPRLAVLMKEELGMFRAEIGLFYQTLQLMPILRNIDTYLRKGARRKVALIRNECFLLSLKLSQMDYSLSPEQVNFWVSEARKHL